MDSLALSAKNCPVCIDDTDCVYLTVKHVDPLLAACLLLLPVAG